MDDDDQRLRGGVSKRGDPAVTQVGPRGDEYEAFDRPGRRSNRPRTKDRPDYADAETGMVITVDRGRYPSPDL